MKTILLPVDFSAASNNAARYAAELSAFPEYQIGRIILLNSYYVSIYEQILPFIAVHSGRDQCPPAGPTAASRRRWSGMQKCPC
jgi:hypothetical protein